jgi:hypothetical protein
MAEVGLKVKGLREFGTALDNLPEEIDKQLKTELLAVAETVAVGARGRMPADSGHARGSLLAGVEGVWPTVTGGNSMVPYYGWLDFGTRTPRRGQPRSRGPWARSGKGPAGGRFIFPEIEAEKDEFIRAANAAFDKAWYAAYL